jgi:hypothetical protein
MSFFEIPPRIRGLLKEDAPELIASVKVFRSHRVVRRLLEKNPLLDFNPSATWVALRQSPKRIVLVR